MSAAELDFKMDSCNVQQLDWVIRMCEDWKGKSALCFGDVDYNIMVAALFVLRRLFNPGVDLHIFRLLVGHDKGILSQNLLLSLSNIISFSIDRASPVLTYVPPNCMRSYKTFCVIQVQANDIQLGQAKMIFSFASQ